MKPYYAHLLKLSGFLLSVFLLQSCDDETAGSWKNEKIKASKREDFHALNDQAFIDLKANNAKHLHYLMSKELIENNYTLRQVELISNHLKENDYTLLDEYYVVNRWRDNDTITGALKDIKSYNLYYPGTTKEMYIAFFVPKTSPNKYMITMIYGKFDYGWKLGQLDVAPYTINGKTAPELFDLGKEQYDKHYLVDAVNNMALAVSCSRPTDIWQYPDETAMRSFYGKLLNEANDKYNYPIILHQVSTEPRIVRIFTQATPDGTFPHIYYLSKIKLKDTTALKKENTSVKKVIGKLIPGIDKDKKYLFYSIFNKMPNPNEEVDRYEVKDRLR